MAFAGAVPASFSFVFPEVVAGSSWPVFPLATLTGLVPFGCLTTPLDAVGRSCSVIRVFQNLQSLRIILEQLFPVQMKNWKPDSLRDLVEVT